MPRFDPMGAARRYAEIVTRSDPQEDARLQSLLERGAAALARSGSAQRADAVIHSDLHHGNVLTADRVYFIDWEYAQVGDPLLDLACIMAYYPRAVAHSALLLNASGMEERGVTTAMLADLTSVFTLLNFLWYRARRVARSVPATDLSLESTALRRLLALAPDGQPRHTSAANLRESQGAVKRNGDAAGD
jgi:aminoglycoside phosphotransferase (APT) family kinase protein